MNYSKQKVFAMCKDIAPQYSFEPEFIYAVCLIEGQQQGDLFLPDVARLEQGYYRKYIEPMVYATTSEVLLSASYGIMQMMGNSLREARYFEWYFSQCDDGLKKILGSPYSQFAIPSGLDAYCVNLSWMIDYGCKWMDRKRKIAQGEIKRTLGLWNGDLSGAYAEKVLKVYNSLK